MKSIDRPIISHLFQLLPLLLAPCCALSLSGQAPIPGTTPAPAAKPAPAAAPQSGQPAGSGGGAGVYHNGGFESNTLLKTSDKVFDPNSDSIDPENGTFIWKGKGFTFGNDRLLGGRFDRYLQTPASEIESRNKYEALLDKILKNLSVYEQNGTWDGVIDAWDLLVQAGEYSEYDGGMSLILGALVYNTWRLREGFRQNSDRQAILRERQKKLEFVLGNRYRHQKLSQIVRTESPNAGTKTVTTEGAVPQNLSEAGLKVKEYGEVQARIAALNTQKALTGKEAQIQFQAQLARFLVDRRFKHVLLGANFYRLLFKGTSQQVIEAKQEIASFFPDSKMTITVDQLAFLAREAINEVETGMRAADNSFRLGNRVTSLKRLQETFFLGEHISTLHSFDDDKRATLFQLKRDMKEARDLIIDKSYGEAEDLILDLKATAKDFESRRIEAGIRKARNASDSALLAAMQYRNLNQQDKAEQAFREAASIWPDNPKLKEFQFQGTQLVDKYVQGKKLFDQLYERKHYREIQSQALEFGVALSEDPDRSAKLKKVVNQMAELDIYLTQADAAVNINNPYAAWEILLKAEEVDPDDIQLNRKKARLAAQVAPFVAELQKASQHETNGQLPSSLLYFLTAQEIYPASSISNDGIQRVSAALLEKLASRQ
jgi:hypothetical protein